MLQVRTDYACPGSAGTILPGLLARLVAFAALLAAAFAGPLRPCEYLTASQRTSQFPVDVCEPWTSFLNYAPKSRKSGAQQRPARMEDLMVQALLWAVSGQLPPSTPCGRSRSWKPQIRTFCFC